MDNKVHPIWKTIHVAVVMGIVTGFLKLTAKNWDDETWAVLGILGTLIVYAFGGDGAKIIANKLGLNGGKGSREGKEDKGKENKE